MLFHFFLNLKTKNENKDLLSHILEYSHLNYSLVSEETEELDWTELSKI